jgi:uncharacterized membrane protein YdjX (TVP38/TMEM64 family)
MRNSSRAAARLLLVIGVSACGAPVSEPATGRVAEDVRASLEGGSQTFDHGAWDRLLAAGTKDGLVDYPYFQEHAGELDAYLDHLAEADAADLRPHHLKALLINAYNALTIRSILGDPEVTSIRQIDGVWSTVRHRVLRHELTLDEIEHNLLRPFFRDPRIHFAVNCASISCAPLPGWAFDGDALDAQLEERTRLFLSDPENARLEGGHLVLTRYFDWYGEDFVAEGWAPRAESIPLFVAGYGGPEIAAAVDSAGITEVRFSDYDWSLNALRPPTPTAADEGDRSGVEGVVGWLRRWVTGFGMAGPVVYGLAYVLGVVLFLPGAPLTIGAGVAFGLGPGTVLVSVASTIGAALAFLIARYLLRGRVERWVSDHERLAAVDRAVEHQGWRVVALTRLSPAFPFNLQNYTYGLTGVPFFQYVLASWIAMLPGTLLYVSIGATGIELASAATGAASWGATTLRVLGFAATVSVVVLITAAARRELKAIEAEIGRSPEVVGV